MHHLPLLWLIVASASTAGTFFCPPACDDSFTSKDVLIADRWRAPLTFFGVCVCLCQWGHMRQGQPCTAIIMSTLLFEFHYYFSLLLFSFFIILENVSFWGVQCALLAVTLGTVPSCSSHLAYPSGLLLLLLLLFLHIVSTCAISSRKRKRKKVVQPLGKLCAQSDYHCQIGIDGEWKHTKAAHLRFPFTCPSLVDRIGISLLFTYQACIVPSYRSLHTTSCPSCSHFLLDRTFFD